MGVFVPDAAWPLVALRGYIGSAGSSNQYQVPNNMLYVMTQVWWWTNVSHETSFSVGTNDGTRLTYFGYQSGSEANLAEMRTSTWEVYGSEDWVWVGMDLGEEVYWTINGFLMTDELAGIL
jgi:hypothetical protein